jgi:6-phosphogluconolactonase
MPDIIRTKSFARDATDLIGEKIRTSLGSSAACVICLAGGKTPISVYEKLAAMELEWDRIYITFGDERNVPPTNKESNYKAAYDSLLSKISIPEDHILRIEAELGPEQAAKRYEEKLYALKKELGRDHIFDIMLLGIGGDGHTASLFPGTEALKATDRLVIENKVPQMDTDRITLTYPAIGSSKDIIFLVNDPSKKEVLEKIWIGEEFPAAHISSTRGKTVWIVGI